MANSCICSQTLSKRSPEVTQKCRETHKSSAGRGKEGDCCHKNLDGVGASEAALIQNPQGDLSPMS